MRRLRGILIWLMLTAVATAAAGALGCASQGVAGAAGESVAAATTVVSSPAPTTSPSPPGPSELAGWSNRRLAAQLVFCSVPATNPSAGRRFARLGVGGIVILGGGARSSIGRDLAAVLKQVGANRWTVSLRARGHVDVAAAAAALGGVGHPRAAGVTLDGTAGEVVAALRNVL